MIPANGNPNDRLGCVLCFVCFLTFLLYFQCIMMYWRSH